LRIEVTHAVSASAEANPDRVAKAAMRGPGQQR
jgi:hypothetical protein